MTKRNLTRRARGRPSGYTQDIADTICERIADGESLRSICSEPGMPRKVTVFSWLRKYPDFAAHYARARETQADSYADEIAQIADRSDLEANDKRVRIDARKWLAGKLRPKKYGDKVAIVGGGDGDAPIQTIDLTKATDEQLERLESIIGAVTVAGGNQGGADETAGDD